MTPALRRESENAGGMNTTAARLQALPEIEGALWRELHQATQDRRHGWRLAVLATVDGQAADARSVVLREADAAARELRLFSDARSPKVRQIDAVPGGTLVLWSAALSWQLRLRVALQVQTDGLGVASRWARLRHSRAAQDYLSPSPPGAPLQAVDGGPCAGDNGHGHGMPAPTQVQAQALPPAPPAAPQGAAAAGNHFALITARVLWIDWLELHDAGHRRAVFDATGARWLTP